jgi:hypothetical protein
MSRHEQHGEEMAVLPHEEKEMSVKSAFYAVGEA